MNRQLRFAAVGLDHRHIYHLIGENMAAGAQCAGICPQTSDSRVLEGVRAQFPFVPVVERDRLLEDQTIDFIVCAAIPRDRAAIAERAMRAGKDVMVDKPGLISQAQVDRIEAVTRDTGRIFSICFSERFMVRACEAASRMVAQGTIGRVIQTTGLGPHRLNRAIRPDWFFDKDAFGGILTDIASHQIDQFLHYTGSADGRVIASFVANRGHPDLAGFEDYGEILLRSDRASGFIRVDWFTADGLPTWGDGRLVLLGTEGTIELRKYVDIASRPGTDHLFLVNREGVRHFDCSSETLTYFSRFQDDVRSRTATAMPDGHALAVSRLAIEAQGKAVTHEIRT